LAGNCQEDLLVSPLRLISHEHSVDIDKNYVKAHYCLWRTTVVIPTKYSPKVSQCGAIFCSILPVNIDHYNLQVKT